MKVKCRSNISATRTRVTWCLGEEVTSCILNLLSFLVKGKSQNRLVAWVVTRGVNH